MQFKVATYFCLNKNQDTMITAMEVAAYVFFIVLIVASFIIGAWLDKSEKAFWRRRKEEHEKNKTIVH
ncbi:MAG: hypothetical protein OHK0057_09730 [Thermoflexibacter sp.]